MLTGWNSKHTLAAIAMLLVFGLVLVFVLNRGGDDETPEATATPTPSATTAAATTPAAEPDPADEAPFVVAVASGFSSSATAISGSSTTRTPSTRMTPRRWPSWK